MKRFLVPVALLLNMLHGSALAQVKGIALVEVGDPARGSIPDIVTGYGIVESKNTLTRSFQREGQVSNVMVEVGDQFKKGDPLLEFGASPAGSSPMNRQRPPLGLLRGPVRARSS